MKYTSWLIAIVTSSLLGIFILINQANAIQTVQLTLSVAYGGFSCSNYPDGAFFSSTTALTPTLLTGDIWSGTFICTDLNPTWDSQLLAQSSSFTGTTT